MPGSRTRWTFLAAFGAGLAAALAPSHAAHHPVTMTSLSYATTDSLVAQGLHGSRASAWTHGAARSRSLACQLSAGVPALAMGCSVVLKTAPQTPLPGLGCRQVQVV